MNVVVSSSLQSHGLIGGWSVFVRGLGRDRHSVAMACLLSFAAPMTFFTGAVSVMREPTAAKIGVLALWWLLYAALLWCLLLASGHVCSRLHPALGRGTRFVAALLSSSAVAAIVTLSAAGRSTVLVEQGVVSHVETMHLYAYVVTLAMGLLYHAHLWRSASHKAAAARLAAAQLAQREIEVRMLHARLQAVQARIDPRLLFEMLDAVRHWYEQDATRAERLLDGLVAFLRAALPRLQAASSSVLGEAELARACVQLRALAGANDYGLNVSVAPDMVHARCPPGLLLPLLDGALRAAPGPCRLAVTRAGSMARLVLILPARPSPVALDGVRAVLADAYGTLADVVLDEPTDPPTDSANHRVTVSLPYELA